MKNEIIQGDALKVLKTLPDSFVDTIITSPPYWGQRDYGIENQIGQEKTPEEYVAKLVAIFHEARRVLKDTGTLWLNLGDTYYGGGRNRGNTREIPAKQKSNRGADGIDCYFEWIKHPVLKTKDLVGIPWRVAFALQTDGWWLRQDIIWHKPNPMVESIIDRCTKSHEYIFLLSKSKKYYFNQIKEPSKQSGFRNKRSVWTMTPKPVKDAHFATFPPELPEICIRATCPEGGIVLDPFIGSGTVAVVARKLNRNYIGIEINPEYIKIAKRRLYERLDRK